jgi:two-component system, OmpR family, alkaline phosphatase synthesis response regulator PhoP
MRTPSTLDKLHLVRHGRHLMAATILIADDEHHIRLLIEQTLESLEDEGNELLMAADGEEALRLALDRRPQVVLLDVMMPKVNGFDVCQRLKEELAPDAPFIVLLTAKGQTFDRIRGDEVGADRYMTKPFDPDELRQTVRAALA